MQVLQKKLWLDHLQYDIMPFWQNSDCLGNPVGNFPTIIDQSGHPLPDAPRYLRMHGRRIYGFLAAYELLGDQKYMEYAERVDDLSFKG